MRLTGPAQRRSVGLAPLIDVVFLLLIFFMLASRFGQDGAIAITLTTETTGDYSGPPRLIDVTPGEVRLNGVSVAEADLASELRLLMKVDSDIVILRARDGANVQRLVDVLGVLGQNGLTGGTILK